MEITDPNAESPSADATEAEETPVTTQFFLALKGLKSVSNSYYNGNVSLQLVKTRPTRTLHTISLKAIFDSDERPQGDRTYLRNAVQIGIGTDVATNNELVQLIKLSGNYNRSHNHLTAGEQLPSEATIENGFGAQTLTSGMFKKGLVRSALTFDHRSLSASLPSYTRLAVLRFWIPGRGRNENIGNGYWLTKSITATVWEPVLNECIALLAPSECGSEVALVQQVFDQVSPDQDERSGVNWTITACRSYGPYRAP